MRQLAGAERHAFRSTPYSKHLDQNRGKERMDGLNRDALRVGGMTLTKPTSSRWTRHKSDLVEAVVITITPDLEEEVLMGPRGM